MKRQRMPLPLTGLNAFVYTGLNAQKLYYKGDGWTVGWKSPGDPILRAPAVLIRNKWMTWNIFPAGHKLDQQPNLTAH